MYSMRTATGRPHIHCRRNRAAVLAARLLVDAAMPDDVPDAAASAAASRLAASQRDFVLASQPTGLLIPLYLYPANVHMNTEYNRLIELKLRHPRVPVCVIIN